MRLADVPNNTRIKVLGNIQIAPGSPPIHKGDILQFNNCDGIYSYCINEDNERVHLAGWTEVEIIT